MNFDPNKLIGLFEQEASYLIKKHGLKYRITKKDGKAAIITRDYMRDRINLEMEKGKVVSAKYG
jgi:hypothetical protein